MSEKRVLITGAAGFIGFALAEALVVANLQVVAVTRDRTRKLPHGTIGVYGDVTDYDFCCRILADYAITHVYHLAAQSIVSACAEDPVGALNVNVMGTARLLQAVRSANRKIRVVCMSSDKCYGHAKAPYTEDTPFDARQAYEVSKASQDQVARMFFHNYDVNVSVVRAVNVYGPGDPNLTRVIPKTIQRIRKGEAPVIHAGAGSMRRQYVYIDDVVSALQWVEYLGGPGHAYNIGSPSPPLSVKEVIEEIQRQMGQTIAPTEGERDGRFREIEEQSVDDTKLRNIGWRPRVLFPEGIAKTIAGS